MKQSSLFLILLLLGEAMLSGCKSPTSVVSNAPYVTITPSNLHQAEFVVDTFQARIFNHDFAQTYFSWDMGDSSLIPPDQRPGENFQAIYSYLKPGKYSVMVNAYDLYTNDKIATTSTSVTIDTAKSSVEIIPQFYTGILPMNNFGLTPFTLSVKTSIPVENLYQFWDYGDGTNDSFLSGPITHIFPRPGSYLLKVDLYQKSGVYVGTDTAAITINWPDISLAAIKQMSRVEAYLVVDSSSPIFNAAQRALPLSIGVPFTGTNITSSWSGNDFSVEFNATLESGTRPQDFLIKGTVTDDGRTITSLTIFAKDSSGNYVSYSFGYTVSNLQFLAVTADKIVFALTGDALKNSLQNLFLNLNNNHSIGRSGTVDNWDSFIKPNDNTGVPSIPQCVLVFSKQ
jgi:hypothetical protein